MLTHAQELDFAAACFVPDDSPAFIDNEHVSYISFINTTGNLEERVIGISAPSLEVAIMRRDKVLKALHEYQEIRFGSAVQPPKK